jgi:hypothetical protein
MNRSAPDGSPHSDSIDPRLSDGLKSRPFAYADVYRHPPMTGRDLPPELASIRKNESSCLVILRDGAWLVTWSQGSQEGALDKKIVFSISRDHGQTWSQPRKIVASTPEWRRSYGCPFVVPQTGRIYLFLHEGRQHGHGLARNDVAVDAGRFGYVYSDDDGGTWSTIHQLPVFDRDILIFPDRFHAHLNHPPQVLPGDRVVLPFSQHMRNGATRRFWQLCWTESSLIACENLLTEPDPARLRFSILPPGTHGMRADVIKHVDNPAVKQLAAAFGGRPVELAANAQEPTVVARSDGVWVCVMRTYLGSPGFAVSEDDGLTWTPVDRLRYAPEGLFIDHPHTMCPLAKMPDGRYILLFTNNDGTRNGAQHVWDGGNRTRSPQWFVVGREIPGEKRNAGLVFGEPRILCEASDEESPDGFRASTCTGISMPQYFSASGRHFIQYGLKKEYILLDEIPTGVIDAMTPSLP